MCVVCVVHDANPGVLLATPDGLLCCGARSNFFAVRDKMKLTVAYRGGTGIDAEWTMAEKPHRVGAVTMAIHLPSPITSEQQERLLKVAHGCTVHQSLAVAPQVAMALNPAAAGGTVEGRG